MSFHVYVLKLKDTDAYYVGQTEDLPARLRRHERGYRGDPKCGAKATRKYGVDHLVDSTSHETRDEALLEERRTIKRLRDSGHIVYGS